MARVQMQGISLLVILQAVFGLHKGKRLQQLKQRLEALLDYTASPFFFSMVISPSLQRGIGFWRLWQRYLEMLHEIDALLYTEIKERRQHLDPAQTDILSLLLSAKDESEQGMKQPQTRSRGHCIGFMRSPLSSRCS